MSNNVVQLEFKPKVPVYLIFAQDMNGVIGQGNKMPWHSPHDFRWFRTHTADRVVIMGKKTWDSLPKKPLPNRFNYVLSTKPQDEVEGVVFKTSLESAILDSQCHHPGIPIFVIGGKSVLEEAAKYADKAYVTYIGVRTIPTSDVVMAPVLPEHEIELQDVLYKGDEEFPSAKAEIWVFNKAPAV